MTRRITVGDSRRAFHVKRGHNREHPERDGRRSWIQVIERAHTERDGLVRDGGSVVVGHDLPPEQNPELSYLGLPLEEGFAWSR